MSIVAAIAVVFSCGFTNATTITTVEKDGIKYEVDYSKYNELVADAENNVDTLELAKNEAYEDYADALKQMVKNIAAATADTAKQEVVLIKAKVELAKAEKALEKAKEDTAAAKAKSDQAKADADNAKQALADAKNKLDNAKALVLTKTNEYNQISADQTSVIKNAEAEIQKAADAVKKAEDDLDAANKWLEEKDAELEKEKDIRQPQIDEANKKIINAQGWIDRKQKQLDDAIATGDVTAIAKKQDEYDKEVKKQQPIIDAEKDNIKTHQGWIDRKQGIKDDADAKVTVANSNLSSARSQQVTTNATQNQIITDANIEIGNAKTALEDAEAARNQAQLEYDAAAQTKKDADAAYNKAKKEYNGAYLAEKVASLNVTIRSGIVIKEEFTAVAKRVNLAKVIVDETKNVANTRKVAKQSLADYKDAVSYLDGIVAGGADAADILDMADVTSKSQAFQDGYAAGYEAMIVVRIKEEVKEEEKNIPESSASVAAKDDNTTKTTTKTTKSNPATGDTTDVAPLVGV